MEDKKFNEFKEWFQENYNGSESYDDVMEKLEDIEADKPKILPANQIDISSLRSAAQHYVDEVWRDGYAGASKDTDYYMKEDVIQTFFGGDIFSKLNDRK